MVTYSDANVGTNAELVFLRIPPTVKSYAKVQLLPLVLVIQAVLFYKAVILLPLVVLIVAYESKSALC